MAARYNHRNHVTLKCSDALPFLRRLPPNSTQLVITSPAYQIGKEYERNVDWNQYLAFQAEAISECVRALKPGGSICWQVGNHVRTKGRILPLDIALHPLFDAHRRTDGIQLRNRIIWHFEHGLNCKRRFSGRYETILWYTKGDDYLFNLDDVRIPQKYPGKKAYNGQNRGKYSGNPLGKNPGDFWAFPTNEVSGDVWVFPNVKANHAEKTGHPCQFPIELPARLILALSNPGDLVLDPFMGAGTTPVAAILLGRRAAGVDYVKEYVATARKRVKAAASGGLKIRPIGKPVYQPPENTPLTTPPAGYVRQSLAKRLG
ncbi:hypothetical protein LCGC14_0124400 [marine sediment metagenome]|uniref:DNA methylase N-4/N-6 domain-containing protein n=1 Tax=marine sediment metagenome TaxID=412755 RepID=A0A0F9V5Y4_9ZZZZ|nr:site-specific DNA-methyltransferase [Phycisphaerae bacterium]HDZ42340.1 site-specific DNA-methyltransferase [Phycisphaerae bacterium]